MHRLSFALVVITLFAVTAGDPAFGYARVAKGEKRSGHGGSVAVGSDGHRYAKLEVSPGLGMIFGSGVAALGPAASLGYSPAMIGGKFPFYVGGELGFIFNFSPFVMFIPILPKAYMKFGVDRQVDIRVGIALGPTIATGGRFSSASFTFLFQPGVDLWLNHNLAFNFDMSFGVMFSSFVFAPRVGVSIPL